MSHGLLGDARFWTLLLRLDEDLAAGVQGAGCHCGGRLDRGDWERKPRGGPDLGGEEFRRRIGLCCAREGCRTRSTPPSVRFFGRRVYLGAIVVLATALRHGAAAVRVAKLREWFGVTWTTLARWRTWWTETFPKTEFWRSVGARFSPPVTTAMLPDSLLDRFAQSDESESLIALLRFLAPITTRTRRRESS